MQALIGSAVAVVLVVGGIALRNTVARFVFTSLTSLASSDSTTEATDTTTRTYPFTLDPSYPHPTYTPAAEHTTTENTTTRPPVRTFDATTLDTEATDQTPLTISALVPDSFTDSKGVVYTKRAADVRACTTRFMDQSVRDLLTRANCRDAVSATYVDKSDQILVMLWVVPLSDAATATTAFDGNKEGSWGVICPPTGAGADICDENKDTSQAIQRGYTRHDHRYLIDADAMYVNLTQEPTAVPWLEAASKQAADEAGPENYSGNH